MPSDLFLLKVPSRLRLMVHHLRELKRSPRPSLVLSPEIQKLMCHLSLVDVKQSQSKVEGPRGELVPLPAPPIVPPEVVQAPPPPIQAPEVVQNDGGWPTFSSSESDVDSTTQLGDNDLADDADAGGSPTPEAIARHNGVLAPEAPPQHDGMIIVASSQETGDKAKETDSAEEAEPLPAAKGAQKAACLSNRARSKSGCEHLPLCDAGAKNLGTEVELPYWKSVQLCTRTKPAEKYIMAATPGAPKLSNIVCVAQRKTPRFEQIAKEIVKRMKEENITKDPKQHNLFCLGFSPEYPLRPKAKCLIYVVWAMSFSGTIPLLGQEQAIALRDQLIAADD